MTQQQHKRALMTQPAVRTNSVYLPDKRLVNRDICMQTDPREAPDRTRTTAIARDWMTLG